MARTVLLRPGAYADIREITHFISNNVSPTVAARWRTRIESAIGQLATDADQYPEATEVAELAIDLREMLHGRKPHVYRILFTFDENTVNILRVRHAAQDHLAQGDI